MSKRKKERKWEREGERKRMGGRDGSLFDV